MASTVTVRRPCSGIALIAGLLAILLMVPSAAQAQTFPQAVVSSRILNFNTVPMYGTSSLMTVTVSNTGTALLKLRNFAIVAGANTLAAEFEYNRGNCFENPTTHYLEIGAGGSCDLQVRFKPTKEGAKSARLNFELNDALLPTWSVELYGVASYVGGEISVSSRILTFDLTEVGTTPSPTKTFTIRAEGTRALKISNITIAGVGISSTANTVSTPMTARQTCGVFPVTLAAGTTCTVTLTFTPTSQGRTEKIVTVYSDDRDEPRLAVDVNGVGQMSQPAGPSLEVVGGNWLSFPLTGINETSSRTLSLRNAGRAPLLVTGLALSGWSGPQFRVTGNSCGSATSFTVAVGGTCVVTVVYDPTSVGDASATLTITSNHNGISGTRTGIEVTGTASAYTGPLPVAQLDPTSWSFGTVVAGSAAQKHLFRVSNVGTYQMTVRTFTLSNTSAGFTITSGTGSGTTCRTAGIVAVGASCMIEVAFTPGLASQTSAPGAKTSELVVRTDAPGRSTWNATLMALVQAPTPTPGRIQVSTRSIGFPATPIGLSTPNQRLTVTNVGTGPLTISNVYLSNNRYGSFVITSRTCLNGLVLATSGAGSTCTIDVRMSPAGKPARLSATLEVYSNDKTENPVRISLWGEGTPTISARFIAFTPGSRTATVTIDNPGEETLPLAAPSLQGGSSAFSIEGTTCGALLAPGGACEVRLAYDPAQGDAIGSLLAWSEAPQDEDDGGGMLDVLLVGSPEAITGTAPVALSEALGLAPIAPNPVTGSARVRFHAPAAVAVRVAIYDVLGHRVAVVYEGEGQGNAVLSAALDAHALPSGVYVVRLESASGTRTQRLTVTH